MTPEMARDPREDVVVHLRFVRDHTEVTYISITDVVTALRAKMTGPDSKRFCDEFARELYEGALRAFED